MKREDFTTWAKYDPYNILTITSDTVEGYCDYISLSSLDPPSPAEVIFWVYVKKVPPISGNFTYWIRHREKGIPSNPIGDYDIWALDNAAPSETDAIPELHLSVTSSDNVDSYMLRLRCESTNFQDDALVSAGVTVNNYVIRRIGSLLSVSLGFLAYPLEVPCGVADFNYMWVATSAYPDKVCYDFSIGPLETGKHFTRALLTGGGIRSHGLQSGGRV